MRRPSGDGGESTPRQGVWGLDAVRCVALIAVVARHQLSIAELDGSIIPPYVGLGIFCVLSGYLSLLTATRKSPVDWLKNRLIKLFIPYIIMMAVVVAANYGFGYKPMSPGLVVAQFFGVAYYTHPGMLIGVHTWFITLILQCYTASALVRWECRLLPVFVVGAFLLAGDDVFSGCRFAYFVGCVAATLPASRFSWGGLALVCGALEYVGFQGACYAVRGAGALLIASEFQTSSSGFLRWIRGISYEFFLVHGPILLGLSRVFRFPFVANLTLGTTAAVLLALLLKEASRGVATWLSLEAVGLNPTGPLGPEFITQFEPFRPGLEESVDLAAAQQLQPGV